MADLKDFFLRKDFVTYPEDHNVWLRMLYENAFILCILIAAITRVFFCLNPKDFWVDESMIALAIDRCTWSDIFQGNFDYHQRCPIGFAVINKILNIFTSYTPHILYITPTILGICLLVLMYRFCLIYERDKTFAFIGLVFFTICQLPLHYSSEFKHYIYEMLVTVILFSSFFSDLKKEYNINTFVSFKYPLLFIGCVLFSNTSVFLSASLCLTMYIYILRHERDNFIKVTCSFIFHYIVYAVFCGLYYILYLKNEESLKFMYIFWDRYFIPQNIHELPAYMKGIFIPMLIGMLKTITIKKIPLLVLPCFIWGFVHIYKKSKYEFLSLFFSLCIAIVAGFGFYPLGHEGIIGARLIAYLFPIVIFISSYGMYKFLSWLYDVTKVRNWVVYILLIIAVIVVFDKNIKYMVTKRLYHQQVFSLFEQMKDSYEDGDVVCIYNNTEPVFEYWMLIKKLKFKYVYLMEGTDIEKRIIDAYDAMPRNKKMFIIYSNFWDVPTPPQTYYALFKARGYKVKVEEDKSAVLHILSKD